MINYFIFDGESSLNYGVYIGGQNTFNAPQRDVAKVAIPGRNGDLIQDNGRFLNVQVPYNIVVMDEFRDRTDAIKAWLLSKKGYCKLVDTYHPGTYRMARVAGGIDFETAAYNLTGKTQVIFDCKPERFLDCGDEVFNVGEWGQTETKSGDIVTFDGVEGMAFKSIKAGISSTQDLHGYEYPWPAGGGKNLIGNSTEQGGISGTGGNITNSARCRTNGFVPVAANTIYTASVNSGIIILSVHFYESDTIASHIETYVTGGYRTLTFTTPETATHVRILYRRDDNQDIIPSDITEPMLEIGDVATTFAPYSNICPITGRTEVTAYLSGRNLITSWNASSKRSNYIRVDLSNGPYVLSYQGTETSIRFWLLYYDANLNYKGRTVGGLYNKLVIYGTSNIFADGSGTLNENNVTFIVCQVYTYTGPNLNDEPLQFEAGDIVTPYAGRTGTTRSLTWQSEAGEVYSGTVDIVTGTLSVIGVGKVFDGTESWTIMSSSDPEKTFFRYVDNRGACPDTDKASSHFRNVGVFTFNTAIGYYAYTADSQPTVTFVQIRPGLGLFTTADWKAWLAAQYAAGTPVECLWTISEPIVYQLTGTEIDALIGRNTVWADSGPIEVEYSLNPNIMLNPTRFASKPKMRVKGQGNGTVTVEENTIVVSNLNEYVDIDSELMNCYKGSANKNADVALPNHEYPELHPGANRIDFSGGVTSVEVKGRWWTI